MTEDEGTHSDYQSRSTIIIGPFVQYDVATSIETSLPNQYSRIAAPSCQGLTEEVRKSAGGSLAHATSWLLFSSSNSSRIGICTHIEHQKIQRPKGQVE